LYNGEVGGVAPLRPAFSTFGLPVERLLRLELVTGQISPSCVGSGSRPLPVRAFRDHVHRIEILPLRVSLPILGLVDRTPEVFPSR
jgi:hypothetical protein